MKPNFCILSIIFAIVVLAINQTVNAQSDNFEIYTNKDLGFSIEHPSNWKIDDERGDEIYFTIRYNPEDNVKIFDTTIKARSYFGVRVDKVESQLDTDTLTLQNKSLEEYVQGAIGVMAANSETLVRQNYFPVGGNDGVKIEYTSNENIKDDYGFRIFTIANGKLYTLLYQDKSLKVPETLPLANKMVESFQFK